MNWQLFRDGLNTGSSLCQQYYSREITKENMEQEKHDLPVPSCMKKSAAAEVNISMSGQSA